MIYIAISVIIFLVVYFKIKSKSDFFKQDEFILEVYRDKLIQLLKIKNRTEADISQYVKAYDYFCKNPKKFDGATIVKDLDDLPNLDLDAMVHDYECLIGANRNYKLWYKAIWTYYENMRKQGKGNQVLRAIGLSILGLGFVPYCYFFTPLYKD